VSRDGHAGIAEVTWLTWLYRCHNRRHGLDHAIGYRTTRANSPGTQKAFFIKALAGLCRRSSGTGHHDIS